MTGCPCSILVAVDFGEASARAVAVGGALAAHCGATLRLLHAEPFEAPPYFTPEQIETGCPTWASRWSVPANVRCCSFLK
jgi:hypothetical protein